MLFTKVKEMLPRLKRKHNKNIKILVTAIAVIMVWRGARSLLDLYLLPEHRVLSNILSIIIGLLILYLHDGALEHLE